MPANDDMQELSKSLIQFSALSEELLSSVITAFSTRDVELCDHVLKEMGVMESQIHEIELQASLIVQRYGPSGNGLASVVKIFRIVGQLDDFTRSIEGLTRRIRAFTVSHEPIRMTASVARGLKKVRMNLTAALDSYASHDNSLSIRVLNSSDEFEELFQSIFRESITYALEDQRDIETISKISRISADIMKFSSFTENISRSNITYDDPSVGENFVARGLRQVRPDIRLSRDHFDIIRDLEGLLGELIREFSKINDPEKLSRDLIYVKAASESMRNFIQAYDDISEIEVPEDLPRSLVDRLKSINLSNIGESTKIAQRIIEIIQRIFL